MSTELTLLVWCVGLTFVQMLVAATGAVLEFGGAKLAGNREGLRPPAGWAGRAQRAHRNMLENFVLFAALVLVTEAANRNDAMTGLGAQMFFWARLAYGIIYVIGVPWLRTAVYLVSAVGLVIIFLQLI